MHSHFKQTQNKESPEVSALQLQNTCIKQVNHSDKVLLLGDMNVYVLAKGPSTLWKWHL